MPPPPLPLVQPQVLLLYCSGPQFASLPQLHLPLPWDSHPQRLHPHLQHYALRRQSLELLLLLCHSAPACRDTHLRQHFHTA